MFLNIVNVYLLDNVSMLYIVNTKYQFNTSSWYLLAAFFGRDDSLALISYDKFMFPLKVDFTSKHPWFEWM